MMASLSSKFYATRPALLQGERFNLRKQFRGTPNACSLLALLCSLKSIILATSNSNRHSLSQFDCVVMASKLQQLRSKAAQASQFVAKHGSAYYKELLEKNKQYIVQSPTIETCQDLSKKLFYTRLASIPGRYESFYKELDGVKHIWRNRKDLTVEDAGIAALFGLELYAWFCVGEIVGRGFTFTGYYV